MFLLSPRPRISSRGQQRPADETERNRHLVLSVLRSPPAPDKRDQAEDGSSGFERTAHPLGPLHRWPLSASELATRTAVATWVREIPTMHADSRHPSMPSDQPRHPAATTANTHGNRRPHHGTTLDLLTSRSSRIHMHK